MDGNTRLCTATAASSLKESFGADGQPGCYEDIDECDALFLYGHNMAATQTVLWSRVLDRLDGPEPPSSWCVDPRETPVATPRRRAPRRAARHEPRADARRSSTSARATAGPTTTTSPRTRVRHRRAARSACEAWTPERAADACGVAAADIRAAARIFGTSERVLSTVLQGFYQSAQATASSCQVNNLHLLRGMIGRPGAGILQMNGQPTAQNNRECGADGDLSGLPQLGEPRPRRASSPSSGASTRA